MLNKTKTDQKTFLLEATLLETAVVFETAPWATTSSIDVVFIFVVVVIVAVAVIVVVVFAVRVVMVIVTLVTISIVNGN